MSKPSSRKLVVVVAIGALLAVLVGGGAAIWFFVLGRGVPGTASSPPVPTSPGGVWQSEVLSSMDANGQVSRTAALEAFAMTYGPIPGVEAKRGDATVPFCGMEVLALLAPHYAKLEPEKKAAIAAAVRGGTSAKATRNQPPPSLFVPPGYDDLLLELAEAGGAPRTPSDAERAFVEGTLQEGRAFIEPHAPRGTPFRLKLLYKPIEFLAGTGSRDWTGAEAFIPVALEARTQPMSSHPECYIRLGTWASNPANGRAAKAALIHELFHCYQYAHFSGSYLQIFGGAPNPLPLWIREGTAAWVGEAAVGGGQGFYADGWGSFYLLSNHYDLYRGSYSAYGFFETLASQGDDVWPRIWNGLTPGVDNDTHFAQVMGRDIAKLDKVPSAAFKRPEWGAAWTFPSRIFSPGLADTRRRTHQAGFMAPGASSLSLDADPGEQWISRVEIRNAELVDVAGNGVGRMHVGADDFAFNGAFRRVYCFTGTCQCPDGRNPFGVVPQRVTGTELLFAYTGVPTRGAGILVSSATIAGSCSRDEPDGGAPNLTIDPCLVGTWKLDKRYTQARYAETLGAYGVEVLGLHGGQTLEIRSTRAFTHSMDPMVVQARSLAAASDMVLTFGGAATGKVGSYGGTPTSPGGQCRSRGAVVFKRVSGNIDVSYKARVGLHVADDTKNLSDAIGSGSASYRVYGDKLYLVPNEPGGVPSAYDRQR